MAYQKQTWENSPSTNTPISAERLNHMEDGIEEAWEHGGGGESLPVGSEIDYTGNVSDIPDGWEQVSGKTYVGKEIYDNATGTTSSISLSESVNDYKYIEIYFRTNDGVRYRSSNKIYVTSENMTASLLYTYYVSETYIKLAIVNINGTSITFNKNVQIANWGSPASGNYIYITRIVGYKEV